MSWGGGFMPVLKDGPLIEMLAHPQRSKAIRLLLYCGMHSEWEKKPNRTGLDPGQILLKGCPEELGLSYQEYRTACTHLKQMGFAKVEPSRQSGTLVTILENPILAASVPRKGKQQSIQQSDSENLTIDSTIDSNGQFLWGTADYENTVNEINNLFNNQNPEIQQSIQQSLTNKDIFKKRGEKKKNSLNAKIDPRKISIERALPEARKNADRLFHGRQDNRQALNAYKTAQAEVERLEAELATFP